MQFLRRKKTKFRYSGCLSVAQMESKQKLSSFWRGKKSIFAPLTLERDGPLGNQNQPDLTCRTGVLTYSLLSHSTNGKCLWRLDKCQDGPRYLAIRFSSKRTNGIKNMALGHFRVRIKDFLLKIAFNNFDWFFKL